MKKAKKTSEILIPIKKAKKHSEILIPHKEVQKVIQKFWSL